jgi:hypothetical protein
MTLTARRRFSLLSPTGENSPSSSSSSHPKPERNKGRRGSAMDHAGHLATLPLDRIDIYGFPEGNDIWEFWVVLCGDNLVDQMYQGPDYHHALAMATYLKDRFHFPVFDFSGTLGLSDFTRCHIRLDGGRLH